jgi:hypothetical protein
VPLYLVAVAARPSSKRPNQVKHTAIVVFALLPIWLSTFEEAFEHPRFDRDAFVWLCVSVALASSVFMLRRQKGFIPRFVKWALGVTGAFALSSGASFLVATGDKRTWSTEEMSAFSGLDMELVRPECTLSVH